jgi:hypothetical protein
MTNLETTLLVFQDAILNQFIDPADFFCINLHGEVRCQGYYNSAIVKKYMDLGYELKDIVNGFIRLQLGDVVLVFS